MWLPVTGRVTLLGDKYDVGMLKNAESAQSTKMLAPFPVYLKSSTPSSSTTAMNDNSDNLLDIIDLFPFSVTPTYEPPSRPPRNPDRLKKLVRSLTVGRTTMC